MNNNNRMATLAACVGLSAWLARPAGAEEAAPAAPAPAAAQEKKAAAPKNRLFMDAQINGKPVRFVFDTGAQFTCLTQASAKRLGLQVIPTPRNQPLGKGEVYFDLTEKCRIALGRQVQTVQFPAVDLPAFAIEGIDGLFAWSSIKDNLVLLDAASHAWKIAEAPEFKGGPGFSRWPLIANPRNFLMFDSSKEPGAPFKIFIDSGDTGGVMLSPKHWEKWQKGRTRPAMTLATWTPGYGMACTPLYRAKTITLGGLSLSDVPVSPSLRACDNLGCDAILGMQALKQLAVAIDGRNNALHTCPNNRKVEPYNYYLSGVTFAPRDPAASDDLVAHVIKDGPAAKAGIRDGDLLLKEDGRDLARWRANPDLMRIRSERVDVPGAKRTYVVGRGGQTLEFTVVLGPYPEAQP